MRPTIEYVNRYRRCPCEVLGSLLHEDLVKAPANQPVQILASLQLCAEPSLKLLRLPEVYFAYIGIASKILIPAAFGQLFASPAAWSMSVALINE